MIKFIAENMGMISVEAKGQIIQFSVMDFAIFFNKRTNSEYWQFPTKWKQNESQTVVSGNAIHYPGLETLEDFIRERRHQCGFKNTGKKPDIITNQLNLLL